MGKWMEEYGSLLVGGVAGSLIIALVLSSGVLSVIGTRAKVRENIYSEYGDITVFSAVCQREKPKITCKTEKQWCVGEVISIEEAFEGKDAEGKELEVRVASITDKNGVNCMDFYNAQNHSVLFPKAGVYTIEVKTQDEQKLCATGRIEFSVDNRKVNE